jgi:two-component system, NtrC family, response regulator AtoC
MIKKAIILIVEDEKSIREGLTFSLSDSYALLTADNGKLALDMISKNDIDLILLDMRLPEVSGLEVLERVKYNDPSIPVIMLTAVKTVESAVKAMKLGAFDYLIKPFDINELKTLIEKALETRLSLKEKGFLKSALGSATVFEKMIGKSQGIKDIFVLIRNVAKSDSTILITGESGTGKELVARAIHEQSTRANRLFIPVNCAAIPENLLESELFGYEKGSFTGALERHLGKFEVASGGTIFLDEIGLMPLSMQVKLLRVLQEQTIDRVGGSSPIPIDVRVIAATNSDLKREVENRKFRSDLFYRLNVIPINVPPLRERKEDILLLAQHFILKFNKAFHKKIRGISNDALAALTSYSWPGNIRELENLMERLTVLCDKDMITNQTLPPEISKSKTTMQDIMLEHAQKFEMDFIKKVASKGNLNDRQMKALEYVKTTGKITKQNYIKLTNSTKTTAFRDINSLVKLHILSQNGIGKASYYTLLD